MDLMDAIRQNMVQEINAEQATREALEHQYGQVWNTDQLKQDFVVEGFMAPLAVARRKSDNVRGSIMFQPSPRFYFSFQPDKAG